MVLQNAGEPYTHVDIDPRSGQETSISAVVPEGYAYVQLSIINSPHLLGPFYNRVYSRAKEKMA